MHHQPSTSVSGKLMWQRVGVRGSGLSIVRNLTPHLACTQRCFASPRKSDLSLWERSLCKPNDRVYFSPSLNAGSMPGGTVSSTGMHLLRKAKPCIDPGYRPSAGRSIRPSTLGARPDRRCDGHLLQISGLIIGLERKRTARLLASVR